MNTELRVGDAERDEVTTALHEHFAQGRLTRDELDERLTATLSAKTIGDLRAVTRDLPAPLAERAPGRGRVPWETGAAHWGRGPLSTAAGTWPHGGWGPPRGHWGPPRGHWGPRRGPFGPLLLVALVVAAFTGWWMILPVLLLARLATAFAFRRHLRHHHVALPARR